MAMLTMAMLAVPCIEAHAGSVMAGGPYAIVNNVALAGQGSISGGGYRVDGTIGESAAPSAQNAGVYRLYAGFWQGERLIPLCLLDIDGDGILDAATDGVLIARAMAGFSGSALVAGALGANATVTLPEQLLRRVNIEALDADGNGDVSVLNDGLIVMRALSGLNGTAVVHAAVGPSALRTSWTQVRDYLNTRCGGAFAP